MPVFLPVSMWISLTMMSGPSAHHEVVLHGDELAVTTTWSSTDVGDGHGRIELVVPLPASVRITGAAIETDALGEVRALLLDEPGARRPQVELRVALEPSLGPDGGLPLPVAQGSEIQRVRLSNELRFLPDASLGLVAHLGQTVPATWRRDDRLDVDARLPGERPRVGGLYVPTDAIVRAGGVLGELEPRASARHRAALGIGVVFVVVCGAAAWAYRRARCSAEAEHAEMVLAAEFDDLVSQEDHPR